MPPSEEGEWGKRCQWQIQRTEWVEAVEKIQELRKPADFFGHRNRTVDFAKQKTEGENNYPSVNFVDSSPDKWSRYLR